MHMHDELVFQHRRARRRRFRLLRLGTADGIKRAMDFIHRKEGRRHAGCGLQKAPPAQALLGADLIGYFLYARFDHFFRFAALARIRQMIPPVSG